MSNSSRTDWEALKRMSDSDIDYSDIPPLGDEFFDRAVLRIPAAQARNLVPLDPDVLAWFESKDPNYKSLINSVLRNYMSSG
jgi:uncharacterized protein (DUF4415 family)